MPKRAELSGDEAATAGTEDSLITTLAGVVDADSTGVDETAALLDLGSFFICLDAAATSSETVAVTVAGVESTEVAVEEVLDVLTILFDYTHISSVFLSSL
jgi:hypothetical protein